MPPEEQSDHKPIYANGILTPVCRLRYSYLAFPDNKGKCAKNKYKITMLLEKESIGALLKAVEALAKEAFPDIPFKQVETPFRDGDTKNDPKCHGFILITPTSKKQPTCLGPNKAAVDPKEIYSGCSARAILSAMSYVGVEKVRDKATGQVETVRSHGITFLIDKVQKTADGERFGGGPGQEFPDDQGEVEEFNKGATAKLAPASSPDVKLDDDV